MKLLLFKFGPVYTPDIGAGEFKDWFEQEKADNPDAKAYDIYTVSSEGVTGGSEPNRPFAKKLNNVIISLAKSYQWLEKQR